MPVNVVNVVNVDWVKLRLDCRRSAEYLPWLTSKRNGFLQLGYPQMQLIFQSSHFFKFCFLEIDSRNELGKKANTQFKLSNGQGYYCWTEQNPIICATPHPTLSNPITKPLLIFYGFFSDEWSPTRLGCHNVRLLLMFRRFDLWAPRLTTFPNCPVAVARDLLFYYCGEAQGRGLDKINQIIFIVCTYIHNPVIIVPTQ